VRLGFHVSIAQGFSRVIEKAHKTTCDTIQLFSRNPRGWNHRELNDNEVAEFKIKLSSSRISPCFLHLPYLPNFAAADEALYSKSVNSLCEDLRRAEILGIPFLIVHVGSRVKSSETEAIAKVIRAINESHQRVSNQVMILLENTAGQGTVLGSRFSQLKDILSGIDTQERIGICLDTAHAFQAGYDLSTRKGLDETLQECERLIGLKKLHLLHLNDSKVPLGSHSDRHWHIGKGYIGLKGFGNIINHPLLTHLPGIMETPRKSVKDDIRNMRVMRSLIKKEGTGRRG